MVPAEGAACQSLQRVENPGNRAPTRPASTSLGGLKAGGGTSGTMLFISLFLNKSEVSRGTDEVIRKDMSGIKPRASRPRRALGTGTLENLRWGLFILYSESAGLGPGCWTSMSPSPLQPVPSEPLGNSGVSSTRQCHLQQGEEAPPLEGSPGSLLTSAAQSGSQRADPSGAGALREPSLVAAGSAARQPLRLLEPPLPRPALGPALLALSPWSFSQGRAMTWCVHRERAGTHVSLNPDAAL